MPGKAQDTLRLRLATAVIGIPIIVVLVLLGGPAFAAVLALILAGGVVELALAAGFDWRRPEVLAEAGIAAGLVPAAYGNTEIVFGLLAAAVMLPLAAMVVRAEVQPESGPQAWMVFVAAVLYVGWLGLHLLFLRRLPRGGRWLLLLLLGVFATDTGAYVTGRLLGRHKLAPRVSPAKTVEGAIGGLFWAMAAVVALGYVLDLPRRPGLFVALGAALAVAAQLGDLAESAIKRRLGIKDMGRLFPGHGGLLDRLDSILFAGTVVYYFVRWLML